MGESNKAPVYERFLAGGRVEVAKRSKDNEKVEYETAHGHELSGNVRGDNEKQR